MAVIPKSLRKDIVPGVMEQRQKKCREDNVKIIKQYGEYGGWHPTVTKHQSKLFKYISYIYLPVGMGAILLSIPFLDLRVVTGAAFLWAIGYFILIYIDDKTTRPNEKRS